MSEINLSLIEGPDGLKDLVAAIQQLTSTEVLVGYPEDGKPREDDQGNQEPVNNATLAYIHDNGAPEANIPARPFMVPGVESELVDITEGLEAGGRAAFAGDVSGFNRSMQMAGMAAQNGIREKITDGPFTPLAEATLRARAARGGSIGAAAQAELDGVQLVEGSPNVRPLIETGQLRQGVAFVVHKKE